MASLERIRPRSAACRSWRHVLLLGILALGEPTPASPRGLLSGDAESGVQLVSLRVSPSIVHLGDVVTVSATLLNGTEQTLEQIDLSVAVSNPTGETVSFRTEDPDGPVAFRHVPPHGTVGYQASIRLLSSGVVAVAVVGRCDLGMIFPAEAIQVRVLNERSDLLSDVLLAFLIYTVILAVVYFSLRLLLRSGGRAPEARPWWRAITAGVALCITAPVIAAAAARAAPPANAVAIWFALELGLFVLGWLTAGAAVRPRGSLARGVALAVVAYIVAGAVWIVVLNSVLSAIPVTTLVRGLVDPGMLTMVLWWPVQVAQYLGFASFG